MKLIIGLGNPGKKHKNNRHNVGFMVLDKLATKNWTKSKSGLLLYSWINSSFELVKPLTFVNDSGNATKYVFKKHKPKLEEFFVIHDDLDIKLGEYKIQLGKGPKDHNGLLDIYEKLGTKDFWHVRVGVENRDGENRIPGEKYVLQDFSDDEKEILEGVIKQICKKLEV